VLDFVCCKNSSPSANHVTKEKLEESHQDAQETLQQNQDLCTVENEGILHLDSQHELHEIDQ